MQTISKMLDPSARCYSFLVNKDNVCFVGGEKGIEKQVFNALKKVLRNVIL